MTTSFSLPWNIPCRLFFMQPCDYLNTQQYGYLSCFKLRIYALNLIYTCIRMTLYLYSEICVMMWKKLNNRYRGMCGIFATYNSVLIHLLLLQSDTSTRSVSENLWYLISFPEIFWCIVSKGCWTLMLRIEKIRDSATKYFLMKKWFQISTINIMILCGQWYCI